MNQNLINLELESETNRTLLNQNQIESGNLYRYQVLIACVGESYLVDLGGSYTGGTVSGWAGSFCSVD